MNRLLCLLQPIEQLLNCKSRAKESIDLDYSSLPPQLVVLKALRSKHFILSTVCIMALFANVLAVAFAGLFRQETIEMRHAAIVYPPFDLKFVPVDGFIGPDARQSESGSLEISGAYRGGNGQDHFLITNSNWTRGTALPAWTDESMFYQPTFSEEANNLDANALFESNTKAFGTKLDCTELELGSKFDAALSNSTGYLRAKIETTVTKGSRQVRCIERTPMSLGPGPVGEPCVTGPSAAELVFLLQPQGPNATLEDAEICMESVVLGWLRTPNHTCGKAVPQSLGKENSTFIQCRPTWKTGRASVRVKPNGRLQQPVTDLILDSDTGGCLPAS